MRSLLLKIIPNKIDNGIVCRVLKEIWTGIKEVNYEVVKEEEEKKVNETVIVSKDL
jgi:hypothetical protein